MPNVFSLEDLAALPSVKPDQSGVSIRPVTSNYDALISEAATKHGLDAFVFRKLLQQESNLNPAAKGPILKSGERALGMAQLMPGTARYLGVTDPHDPVQAIDGGARYLAEQLKSFGGDYSKALAAYNAGPGAVQKFGGIPPYPETQKYVSAILGPQSGRKQAPSKKPAVFSVGDLDALPDVAPAAPVAGQQQALPPKPLAGPPVPAPGSRYRSGIYLSPFTGEAPRPRKGFAEKAGRVAQQFLMGGTEEDEATNAYYAAAEANPKIAPPLAPRTPEEKMQAKSVKSASDQAYKKAVGDYRTRIEELGQTIGKEHQKAQEEFLRTDSPKAKAAMDRLTKQWQQSASEAEQLTSHRLSAIPKGSGEYFNSAAPSFAAANQERFRQLHKREVAALVGASALVSGEAVGALAAPAVRAGFGVVGGALARTGAGKVATGLAEKGIETTAKATRKLVNAPIINPIVRGTAAVGKTVGRVLKPDEAAIQNAIAGAIQQPATYVASTDPKDIKADKLLGEALTGAAAGWFITGGFKLTGEGLRFIRNGLAKGLNAEDLLRKASRDRALTVDKSSYAQPGTPKKTTPVRGDLSAGPKGPIEAPVRSDVPTNVRPKFAATPAPAPVVPVPKRLPTAAPGEGGRLRPKPRVPAGTVTEAPKFDPAAHESEQLAEYQRRRTLREQSVETSQPEAPAPAAVVPKEPSFSERLAQVQKQVVDLDATVTGRLDKAKLEIEKSTWEPEDAGGRYRFRNFDTRPRLQFGDEPPLTAQETDDLLRMGAEFTSNKRWHVPKAYEKTLGEIGSDRLAKVDKYLNTDEGIDAIDSFFNRLDEVDNAEVAKDVHTQLKSTGSTPLQILERARHAGAKTPEDHRRLPMLDEVEPSQQGYATLDHFTQDDLDTLYKHLNTKGRSSKEYTLAGSKYSLKALIYDAKTLPNDAAVSVPRKMKGVTKTETPAPVETPKANAAPKPRSAAKVTAPKSLTPETIEATARKAVTDIRAGKPVEREIYEQFGANDSRDAGLKISRRISYLLRHEPDLIASFETPAAKAARKVVDQARKSGNVPSRVQMEMYVDGTYGDDRWPRTEVSPDFEARVSELLDDDPELAKEIIENWGKKLYDSPTHPRVSKPPTSKPAKTTDKVRAAADKLEAEGKAQLAKSTPMARRKKGSRTGGTIHPDDLEAIGKIVAAKMMRGTANVADALEAAARDVGEDLKPHAEAILAAAKKHWDSLKDQHGKGEWPEDAKKPAPAPVTPAVTAPAQAAASGTVPVAAVAKPASAPTLPVTHVPRTTGIRNVTQTAEVAQGRLPRAPLKVKLGGKRAIAAKGKADAANMTLGDFDALAQTIAQGERPFTKDEGGILKQGARAFHNEVLKFRRPLDAALDALKKAQDEHASVTTIDRLRVDVANKRVLWEGSEKNLVKFLDNVQRGKSEWAAAGRSMQGELDLEYGNYEAVAAQARRLKGSELSKRESDALTKLTGDLEKVQAKLKAIEDLGLGKEARHKANQRPRSSRSITEIRASRDANAKDLLKLLKESKPVVTPHLGAFGGIDVDVKKLRELTPEIKSKLGALAKDLWEEGAVGLKGIVDGVRDIIGSEAESGVTDSDIAREYLAARNLGARTISQETKDKALATKQAKRYVELEEKLDNGETLTETEKRERGEILESHKDLEDAAALKRREEDIQARQEKVKAGPMVGPPEPKPEELPHIKTMLDELTDLRKQQSEAIKAAEAERLRPEREAAEAARKSEAAAKALARKQQELQEKIKTAAEETVAERADRRAMQKAEWEARKAERAEELQELDAELAAVQQHQRDLDAEARYDAEIAGLKEQIAKGDYSANPAKKRRDNELLKQKQQELRELRSERLLRQKVADLEAQSEQGFGTIQGPPKPEKEVSEEILNLQARKALYESYIKQRMDAMKPKEFGDVVKGIVRKPAALVASIDISAAGRQGWLLGLSHPIIAARAFRDQLAAMASPEEAAKQQLKLMRRENAPLYKRSGLFLADSAGLGPGEEVFMTHIFPGWKKWNPFGASERAYSAYLNRLRADSFDAMVNFAGDTDIKTMEGIAHYINSATGRGGSRSKDFSGAAPWLSSLLFSPRFVRSRFEYLGATSLWHGTKASRKTIFGEYARTLGALTIALGSAAMLAKAQGFEVNTSDSASADYLKLKKGNVRIDLLAGLQQAFVLAERIRQQRITSIKGKTTDLTAPKYGQTTNEELLGRFFRSKLNPALGTAWSLWSNTDFMGHPYGPVEAGRDLVTPLSAREIVKGIMENGWTEEDAWNLLNLLGISVQIYEDKPKK